jgi:hypothetical protein
MLPLPFAQKVMPLKPLASYGWLCGDSGVMVALFNPKPTPPNWYPLPVV